MAPPPITNGMMSQGPPPGNPNLLTALSSEKMYPPGYNMVFHSHIMLFIKLAEIGHSVLISARYGSNSNSVDT